MSSSDSFNETEQPFPEYESLSHGIDVVWVSVATYLVFLMQLGFAFLEAGAVRGKNIQSILYKNCFDVSSDTIMWWLVGFGFAFGES